MSEITTAIDGSSFAVDASNLSKGFDCVDHNILFRNLLYYG